MKSVDILNVGGQRKAAVALRIHATPTRRAHHGRPWWARRVQAAPNHNATAAFAQPYETLCCPGQFPVILNLSGNLRFPALISSKIHMPFQCLLTEFPVNSRTGNFASQNRE